MGRTRFFRAAMALPLPRKEVFAFFANVENLSRITPDNPGFEILTPLPVKMREGAQIDCRLSLLSFPLNWKTEIAFWQPPYAFVHRQIEGPYALWEHTHTFEESDEGNGTIVRDEVRYRLPYWPLGEVAAPFVRVKLRRIFRYRQAAALEILLSDSS